MLTRDDVRGVYALPPTPCKEGAGGWDVADSVDLDETARLVENLIAAGVGGIGVCGTTGECAALLWDEKRDYVDTVVQVTRKRVPVIAGATALGTKEVVRQMRGLKDVGADGVLVGLPLWQTPTPGELGAVLRGPRRGAARPADHDLRQLDVLQVGLPG